MQAKTKHIITIFFVIFLFNGLSVFSQNQKLDSVYSTNQSTIAKKKDSITNTSNRNLYKSLDSLKMVYPSFKQEYKLKKNGINNILPSPEFLFNDKSNLLKNDVSKLYVENRTKPLKKSRKNSLLNRLDNYVKVDGIMRLESYASNSVTPFQLNEAKYIRFSATPRLTLFGLPFQSDIYYTTENNTFYNSNGIGIHFDPYTFKQNLIKKGEKHLQQKKSEYLSLKSEEEKLEIYKSDVKRLLKNEYSNLENGEQEIRKRLREVSEQNIDKPEIKSPKYDDSTIKNKLKDTALNNSQNHVKYDSQAVHNILKSYQKIIDTRKKIETYESYYHKAESLRQELHQVDSIYSHWMDMQSDMLKNKSNSELNKTQNRLKNISFLNKIEELDIGISNPYYTSNTIDGIPLKGINLKFNHNKIFYRVSAGRTISDFFSFSTNQENSNIFTRNLLALKIGYGKEFGDHVYVISSNLWDPNPLKIESDFEKRNFVTGFGFSNLFFNSLLVNGEILGSLSKASIVSPKDGIELINQNPVVYQPLNTILSNNSICLKSKYALNQKTKFEFEFDQKKMGFQSFGSPFLRRDYRQIDFSFQRSLLKNKISFTSFYKYFIDNISQTQESTNDLKGLGLTLGSAFTNYPNFSISHLPFEQGNNHSDSLFRTNNQFSTTTGVIYYSKSIKRVLFNWNLSYSRSMVEYHLADNKRALTTFYGFSQQAQYRKSRISLNYIHSLTQPSIDSLNFQSLNLHIQIQKKRFQNSASFLFKMNANDDYMYSVHVKSGYQLNHNFLFCLQGGLRYYNGIWGLTNEYQYYGGFDIVYRFGKANNVIKAE